MNVDFLHNQIIRDTITDKFIESFNENLLSRLVEIYSDELSEVQFYEDHLSDGFRINGEFHYPLTLVLNDRIFTQWIKWQVSNYRHYDKFNPFSYKGKELLNFEILDEVAAELKSKMAGKVIYADSSYLPVVVSSPAEDKTFLSGKYSQCFIDELSRSVTGLISEQFSIRGLAESGVVLEVRFAPGSFMEHIAENTTYRRILIKARGCAPRDLWIKWTRLDKNGTYTVSDDVSSDEILFELADNVPGKIKEKEYRYLTAESVDKYQNAMSRKNLTEWREMMRRVIRRAEVEKIPEEGKLAVSEKTIPEIKPAVEAVKEPIAVSAAKENSYKDELNDKLSAILSGSELPREEDDSDEEINSDLNALLKSVMGIPTDVKAPTEESKEECENEAEEDEFTEEIQHAPATFSENDEKIDEEITAILANPTPQAASPTLDESEKEREIMRRELEAKLRAQIEEELRAKSEEAEALRARLEEQLRAETREKELMAEAARAAIEEQRKLAAEREKERAVEEENRKKLERERAEEEARLERERAAEAARLAEEEARAKAEAAKKSASSAPTEIKYVSKTARLIFRYSISSDITKRIHEIIVATIKYFGKEDVYIRIKATIPDSTTVNLEFTKIPENEIPLLVNIIKVLGRSELGITKAILD